MDDMVLAGVKITRAPVRARVAQAVPPSRLRPQSASENHRGRTRDGRPTGAGGGCVGEAAAACASAEQLAVFAAAPWSRCAVAMAANAAPNATGQLFRAETSAEPPLLAPATCCRACRRRAARRPHGARRLLPPPLERCVGLCPPYPPVSVMTVSKPPHRRAQYIAAGCVSGPDYGSIAAIAHAGGSIGSLSDVEGERRSCACS